MLNFKWCSMLYKLMLWWKKFSTGLYYIITWISWKFWWILYGNLNMGFHISILANMQHLLRARYMQPNPADAPGNPPTGFSAAKTTGSRTTPFLSTGVCLRAFALFFSVSRRRDAPYDSLRVVFAVTNATSLLQIIKWMASFICSLRWQILH